MLPFERFTYPAEKALTAAQQEAEVSRRGYIGTGNLLLVLSAGPDFVAARVLRDLGVDDGALRSAIERQPSEESPAEGAELHPTEPVKRAVEFAFTESKRTDDGGAVGTGHLLLGILLEGSAAGARALAELGVGVERVRADIGRLAAAGLGDEPWARGHEPSLAISREVSDLLNSAHEIARAEQAPTVLLDHLVRALRGR
jgi:ATP-dependent Clp protease ATP-binding subunit ClpA